MNGNLLKSKMLIFGDTNQTLADAIGISAQRLSAKKNETNGAEFRPSEIKKIAIRYGLSMEEVHTIFFDH
ncbi:MAG: helix-turn-helix transcriptional regulator [Longicatena sp.]